MRPPSIACQLLMPVYEMPLFQSSIVHSGRERPRRTVLAVLLITVLMAACGGSASPSPFLPLSSPMPSNSESGVCTSADVRAMGGPWGAAAGSRGTDISVENVGSSWCLLPASPGVALVGAAGSTLLASSPVPDGSGRTIGPGETIGFSLVFSNWCDQAVGLPLHFRLALASGEIEIADLAVTSADELAPCNGPGQPAVLSATEWEPR
jgi:hypothetical protein